jgi:hypothetical protein
MRIKAMKTARTMGSAMAILVAVALGLMAAPPKDVEKKRGRKPKALRSSDDLIRQQNESGLTLLTIDDGALKYIDFRTHTLRTLKKLTPAMQPFEEYYCIDYSRKLLVGTQKLENGNRVIFVANLADDTVKRFEECFADAMSLSTNGQWVAYVTKVTQQSDDWELWRLDLKSKANDLLSVHVLPSSVPQWSSDDKYILFDYEDAQTKHKSNSVAIFDVQAKTERVVAKSAYHPSWKPNSKQYLFWGGGELNQSSIDRADHRETVTITGSTTNPLNDLPARYSPSGSFLAYLRGSPWDILNYKGFSEVELMIRGEDEQAFHVFGPYTRNKKLSFFWAEVPEAKKSR